MNAAIMGGNVEQGALIGAMSAGMAKGLGEHYGDGMGARMAAGAITGGVGSVMSGGDFFQGAFQGAWTSAIAYVCNDILHRIEMQSDGRKIKYYKISNEVDEVIDPWTDEGKRLYFFKGINDFLRQESWDNGGMGTSDYTALQRAVIAGYKVVMDARIFPDLQILKLDYAPKAYSEYENKFEFFLDQIPD